MSYPVDDHGFDHDPEKFYRDEIERLLNKYRPNRVPTGDKEWKRPVYEFAREHLPNPMRAIERAADQEVDGVDGRATQKANAWLRRWAKGLEMLDWALLGPLPATINGIRVRFDALDADDLEMWADEREAEAKATFDEVMTMVDGARRLAKLARSQDARRVSDLGNQEPLA